MKQPDGAESLREERPDLTVLGLDGAFSIGEQAFSVVEELFLEVKARTLVEFGSGRSTARLAQSFPEARILSLESGHEYWHTTSSVISEMGFHKRVTVELRELQWFRVGWGMHCSYRWGGFPGSVDAVLIDGPPGWACRGREACLYQVWNSLRKGGTVILDDYARPGERMAARAWKLVFGGAIELEELVVGHGLCVVRKVRHILPQFLNHRMARLKLWSCYRFLRSTATDTLRRRPMPLTGTR